MQRISLIKWSSLFFFILFILGIIISFVFDADFVEKYIDEDGHIGEHVKTRVNVFQNQMFYLSLFFGLTGLLILIFQKNLARILNKRREFFSNVLLLVVALIFFVIVGEAILRIFFSEQIYSEYGNGPGGLRFMKSVEYNTLGFRDVEHKIEKDNKSRILIIGDSFTFGYGMYNPENVYPRILQKKLDEKYGANKFEVVKLAVNGYSTIDALNILNSLGLNLSPDLIILAYTTNDAEGPGSRIGFEKMFYRHFIVPYEIGSWLYSHSFMYYLFESRLKNILKASGLYGSSYEDYIIHLYSDSNPFLKEHKKYLESFINTGKKREIPVVIMIIPEIVDFEDYPFTFINDYVKNVTLSNEAWYLNLLPNFSQYNPNKLKVSFMDTHINEFGNELTANILFNFLEKEGLIKNVKK